MPDPRRWLALAVIAASTLMVVLDVSIVNIALPRSQVGLGISDASNHWAVTAHALALGGLLLLGGRVADFVGRYGGVRGPAHAPALSLIARRGRRT